jgi:hypothetical protein
MITISTLGVLAASAPASAVSIDETKCVQSTLETVKNSITDYGAYHSLPGATLTVRQLSTQMDTLSSKLNRLSKRGMSYFAAKLGFAFLAANRNSGRSPDDPTIKMIPVQIPQNQPPHGTRLFVDLIPHDIKSGTPFRKVTRDDGQVVDVDPRFGLICDVTPGEKSFTHHCDFDSSATSFGVTQFTSHLEVHSESSDCPRDHTRLHYKITFESNPNDIGLIKKRILSSYPGLGALAESAGALFDEPFLEAYYNNFYSSWVDSVSRR